VRPPRRATAKKRGGGLVVAAGVLLAIGAGGAGGYLVYTRVLNAPVAPAAAPAGPLDLRVVTMPPIDAALVSLRDSMVRAEAERLRALPDSGWLVVRGVPDGARLFVGEQAYRDTILWLGVGTQKIRVSATGYENFDGSIAVPKADTAKYAVTLKRLAQAAPSRPVVTQPPAAAPAGQCTNPAQRTYNLNSVCFDQPPRLRGGAFVPVPAGVPPTTRPVFVLVHVGADGRMINTFPVLREGDDANFMRLAVRFARNQTYQPATKAGRPVEAFFRFRFAPQSRQ
jgi:hypothetical protein